MVSDRTAIIEPYFIQILNQLTQDINQLYSTLILSKTEGLTVYVLSQKIDRKEIPQHFAQRDIEQAIKEATELEPGGQPQTEKIIRVLLYYFIEHPLHKRYEYMLTDYAQKFVRLIKHKLDNPYKKFPLRKTFDRFAKFKAEGIHSIIDFRSWHELQFHETSRQTILDHLEALKDDVNSSIQRLNAILKDDSDSAMEMVGSFTTVFNQITAKSDQIKDTLRLGSVLEQEVEKVVTSFYEILDALDIPQNEEEEKEREERKNDYQEAFSIKESVSDFFQSVDDRLDLLTSKTLYASTQLKSLQDNFRNHSQFRINIKKFLRFTLEEAEHSKNGPYLPAAFPLKKIPVETFLFVHVPYYESFGTNPNYVIIPQENEEYAKRENSKVLAELNKQESTAKLVKKYKTLLSEVRELDFTDHFYKILATENDSEIAMNVGFELFQFANSHPEYKIKIRRELSAENMQKEILTWNMKIMQNQKPTPLNS